MNIRPFILERIQSLYENTVEYNLTESGFHPFTLTELLEDGELKEINNTILGYGQTNGSPSLRKVIAGLYKGCNENNILVTNGSSEANFVACHTLLEEGDEMIMMLPNYMQIWGVAEEMGCLPSGFHLQEKKAWAPDLDELNARISGKTKMIAVCNPSNPTGNTLTLEEMQEIVKIASRTGAWIYSDEIYRGAELDGKEIPSFFGLYDRVMVCGGLSKSYGLPGLRLGWLAGPEQTIENCWSYHDYTSITAGTLSYKIGEIVLQPSRRTEILDRNRKMLNENLEYLKNWIEKHDNFFHFIPPKAGGMAFMRYNHNINSTQLSDWLRINKSLLILPGDVFAMDGYFRLGIGARRDYLVNGLERLRSGLVELVNKKAL